MRYKMDNGTIIDTDNASYSWAETTDWNGRNHISRASGSQWEHQKLYRSRKGRYYIEFTSQWQGTLPRAEWVSNEAAAQWLLLNDHKLIEELKELELVVSE